jgi:hypothetical protein
VHYLEHLPVSIDPIHLGCPICMLFSCIILLNEGGGGGGWPNPKKNQKWDSGGLELEFVKNREVKVEIWRARANLELLFKNQVLKCKILRILDCG